MSHKHHHQTPWYLWPFKAIWELLTFILSVVGRIVMVVVGFALLIVGLILTVTIIASPVGIPLVLIGLLLVFRGIF